MAGLQQTALLVLADGTEHKVPVDARDLRAWESAHNKSAIVTRPDMRQSCWVVWNAGKRQGYWTMSYDEFDGQCVDLTYAEADEAGSPDPTQTPPTEGPS